MVGEKAIRTLQKSMKIRTPHSLVKEKVRKAISPTHFNGSSHITEKAIKARTNNHLQERPKAKARKERPT